MLLLSLVARPSTRHLHLTPHLRTHRLSPTVQPVSPPSSNVHAQGATANVLPRPVSAAVSCAVNAAVTLSACASTPVTTKHARRSILYLRMAQRQCIPEHPRISQPLPRNLHLLIPLHPFALNQYSQYTVHRTLCRQHHIRPRSRSLRPRIPHHWFHHLLFYLSPSAGGKSWILSSWTIGTGTGKSRSVRLKGRGYGLRMSAGSLVLLLYVFGTRYETIPRLLSILSIMYSLLF